MRTFVIASLWVCSTLVGAQPATVRVTGPRVLTVSASDLAAMPRTIVKASAHNQDATYEGVAIRELLTRAGVPTGDALKGRELAAVVVVTGADGYRAAYGLAEFDPGFTDRIAILADRKNGATLTDAAAPFQLILTGEKRAARWVREVISIEVQAVGSSKVPN